MTMTDLWVGRSIRRVEDPALVRGEGRYVGDAALGMETARFVRSTMPSGVIRSIDGPCYTIADLDAAGVGEIEAVLHRPDFVKVRQPLLARDRGAVCRRAHRRRGRTVHLKRPKTWPSRSSSRLTPTANRWSTPAMPIPTQSSKPSSPPKTSNKPSTRRVIS